MTKVDRHMEICEGLNEIYEQKNHDYGDSFHDTFVEEGMAMARIRLSDKLNRFKKLSKAGSKQKVNDESIRDTLLDLANYAIMTVMEIDIQAEEGKRVRLGEKLSKMKDEAEAALEKSELLDEAATITDWELKEMERQSKLATLTVSGAINGNCVCPYCGNKMACIPKTDKYICSRCGTIFVIDRTAAVQRGDTDPDPCEKCTYPAKATCGGCMDRIAWEKRQRGDTDAAEVEQADGR